VRPVERSIVGPILNTRSTMSSVVASRSAAGLDASSQASQFGRTDDALIGEALADHCEDIELPRREWIAGAVAELPCTVRYVVCFQQRKHISARH